jgi:hypothetical protein
MFGKFCPRRKHKALSLSARHISTAILSETDFRNSDIVSLWTAFPTCRHFLLRRPHERSIESSRWESQKTYRIQTHTTKNPWEGTEIPCCISCYSLWKLKQKLKYLIIIIIRHKSNISLRPSRTMVLFEGFELLIAVVMKNPMYIYKVRIKSIGKSPGKIDLFQILLQCLKILQNTSLVHRYTFANGVATTRRLPGRRIPEGP